MNKIKLGEKEYDLEEDRENFAYKNGVIYKVFKTTKSVMAMGCIGAMRFVLDEQGQILSEAYPMMNLSGDFELISEKKMDHFYDVVRAFDVYKEFNLK